MARIRTIKPDFFTSEDIVSLSPLARLLYIATWLEADREGRFVWRPGTLKLRYLPGDDHAVDALASELTAAGLIVLYEAEGKRLAVIPTFKKHQVINNRETESELPAPPDACITRAPRVDDASSRVHDAPFTPLVGREGKGREGKEVASSTRAGSPKARTPTASKSKTMLPADFCISPSVQDWASSRGISNLDAHLESFKAKCLAKAYTYANWDAAFMEAIRNDWAKLGTSNGDPRRPLLHADETFTGAGA